MKKGLSAATEICLILAQWFVLGKTCIKGHIWYSNVAFGNKSCMYGDYGMYEHNEFFYDS